MRIVVVKHTSTASSMAWIWTLGEARIGPQTSHILYRMRDRELQEGKGGQDVTATPSL